MAVETTATSASFTGTGTSATYAPGFYINSSDQVKVYVDGVLQTIGDDYTVNNVGLSTGCNIVGTFALSAEVYIERVTPITQLVDTQNNETILEDVLDAAFDKLTMISQEIDGALDRALLIPKGETATPVPSPTSNPGRYLATDASGVLIWASGSGADGALRTDLATSTGATLIGVDGGGTVQDFIDNAYTGGVSIFRYLTDAQIASVQAGNLAQYVTAAIQTAFDDTDVDTLIFPPGIYKVSASEGDLACLNLTRPVNLLAPGGWRNTTIQGALTGVTTASILRAAFTGSGDVRGWEMRGLGLLPSGGGKHGLFVDYDGGASLPMLSCYVRDCYLGRYEANGGYAAYLDFQWAHGELSGCTLSGEVYAACGDRCLFQNNLSFGNGAGYIFDLAFGVRNNTVQNNTIVNRDGAMHIINGDNIRFLNNQCEQVGANATTESAMVIIEGSDRKIYNTVIENNNFGGGTNLDVSVYIDNADGTVIDGNNFLATGQDSIGGNADVQMTANSSNTRIGANNQVTGNIFSDRGKGVLYVRTIDEGGGSTYSQRNDLNPVNGWSVVGCYKDTDGIVRFVSDFVGGTTTTSTTICTLPQGWWPLRKQDAVRRNLLTSTGVLGSPWTFSSVDRTDDAAVSPWGIEDAILVTAQATTAAHLFRSGGTALTGSTRYQASFYVKRVTGSTQDNIRVSVYNEGFTAYAHALVSLATGTVSGTGLVGGGSNTTTTTAVGSWWRVNFDYTVPSSGNWYVAVCPDDAATVLTSFTGDPAVHQVYFCGPQIEQATSNTAYQEVTSDLKLRTMVFDLTVDVMTSAGAGTITISEQGVVKAGTLPAADFAAPDFRGSVVA